MPLLNDLVKIGSSDEDELTLSRSILMSEYVGKRRDLTNVKGWTDWYNCRRKHTVSSLVQLSC